jgi:hypothetical protein
LPQVHPIGIRTTLRRTHSAVFKCCIGPGRGRDKEKQKKEERNEIKEEEFAAYARVCHD